MIALAERIARAFAMRAIDALAMVGLWLLEHADTYEMRVAMDEANEADAEDWA